MRALVENYILLFCVTAMLGWASLSDAGYHDNNDVKDKFVKLVWQRSY